MTNSPYFVTNYEEFKSSFPHLEPCSEPDFNCIWSIDSVDVIPEKNGIKDVIEKVYISVTREGATESFKMPVSLDTENISIDTFAEFGSLNQLQVIEWVKDVLTNLRQDFVWDCEWAAPAPNPIQNKSLPV